MRWPILSCAHAPSLATAIVVVSEVVGVQRAPVAAQAAQVPLAVGLNFTTTSHSGLVAGAGSVPIADTEIVYSVVDSDNDRLSFRFSVSAPNDSAAGKLLDGVPRSFNRTVRREDLRAATRLTVLLSSEDTALIPGQTFASTSGAVLGALHATGKTAFVLGVNEPDQGLAALATLAGGGRLGVGVSGGAPFVAAGVASMLSSMSVVRHYYRGTLEREGAADEPFSVLLDGRRTTVPAMHVRGALAFTDHTITPELWWLDDGNNPLTLKWAIGSVYETVTRIDRPNAGESGVARAIADGLARSCRAELSGVYFTTASAEVLEASMPALERFAAVMRAHADWPVTIEGHTDNIGSADYNLDLSTRRAAAVRGVLTRRFGVPAGQLQTKGYGLTRPVETNATDEGRAHNRRVEVSRPCNGT